MEPVLNFFVSAAQAAAGGEGGGGLIGLLPLVAIFAIFYFLLIRPQQKRAKQHRELVAAIKKGDEIATNGGAVGKVVGVEDNFIRLEIAKNVVITVQRHAVAQMLPEGTIKSS